MLAISGRPQRRRRWWDVRLPPPGLGRPGPMREPVPEPIPPPKCWVTFRILANPAGATEAASTTTGIAATPAASSHVMAFSESRAARTLKCDSGGKPEEERATIAAGAGVSRYPCQTPSACVSCLERLTIVREPTLQFVTSGSCYPGPLKLEIIMPVLTGQYRGILQSTMRISLRNRRTAPTTMSRWLQLVSAV